MPENASLNRCIDQIELGFVERERTPKLLMKLSIQLHLAGLSLSNTVSILEIFGVERARSTVHNWVHKADLQPEDGQSPDHVAVDETVIQLNDEKYWLYAAVDSMQKQMTCVTHRQLSLRTVRSVYKLYNFRFYIMNGNLTAFNHAYATKVSSSQTIE